MSRLAPPLTDRNETALERSDRHLAELLQEVRVAQTGVQVLFGFLLMVPLSARFDTLVEAERLLYFGTLLSAGAAAMLLIAPGSQHRILFRCGDKEHIVAMANRYAIAGLAFVALAMVGAVLFVSVVVLDSPVAGAVAAIAALGVAWCWYLQPMRRRRQLQRWHRDRGSGALATTGVNERIIAAHAAPLARRHRSETRSRTGAATAPQRSGTAA